MAQTYVPQIASWAYATAAAAVAAVDPPVDVFLGAPLGQDIPARYVAVMWAGPDDQAVIGQRVRQTHSEHWAEEFDLWCCVSTGAGDEDPQQQLTDTADLYALVTAAVAADRQAGGLLAAPGYVELGQYQWTVEDGGQVATVFFTLHVSVKWGQ